MDLMRDVAVADSNFVNLICPGEGRASLAAARTLGLGSGRWVGSGLPVRQRITQIIKF